MTDLTRLKHTLFALQTLPEFLRQYPSLAVKLREALDSRDKPTDTLS
jgi:hypothetical protein